MAPVNILGATVRWIRHVDHRQFKRHVKLLHQLANVDDMDMGVKLVDEEEGQAINREYRGIDAATDVLSFPYEIREPGKPLNLNEELGDLVICVPYVARQCHSDSTTMSLRLPVLITHGICHLLGYTHDTEENTVLMREREKDILDRFNVFEKTNLFPLTVFDSEME